MNTILLEGKSIGDCEVITERNTRTNRLETVAHITVESLIQVKPRVYHTQEYTTTDPDLMSIMKDIKAGDHVIAQGILHNEYNTDDHKRAPIVDSYSAICTAVRRIDAPLKDDEECISSLVVEGKATSDCSHDECHYPSATLDIHKITVVSQVQGDPSLDCQIQMQSYDPEVTYFMDGIEKGDRVIAIGKPASLYRDPDRKKLTFKFAICESIKKWNQ